jgi:hypothetical protein
MKPSHWNIGMLILIGFNQFYFKGSTKYAIHAAMRDHIRAAGQNPLFHHSNSPLGTFLYYVGDINGTC